MTLDEAVAYALEARIRRPRRRRGVDPGDGRDRVRIASFRDSRALGSSVHVDPRSIAERDGARATPDPGLPRCVTCANCGAEHGRAQVQAHLPLRLLPVLLGLLLSVRSVPAGPSGTRLALR